MLLPEVYFMFSLCLYSFSFVCIDVIMQIMFNH